MADKALVIIDMLNDFVREDAPLRVPGADILVPVIDNIAQRFRGEGENVIFLCDAHDPDDPEFQDWPAHAVRDTEGAEVVESLAVTNEDRVIKKKHIDIAKEPQFFKELESLKVETVYVTGVATEHCVLTAVRALRDQGYQVLVITDAVAGVDKDEARKALREMLELGASEQGAVQTLNEFDH
ncbi:cysteine hydrolase family protein [Desulfohalovibrio reitneri]|uniref:cysteine hydrolase family protein n=1 Tax=Desulfohalovibrio reitneri TaxID=1307759 RepID=UPI00068F49E9|nr:isochorismatase family cysteine hydrolase [Desulfohalovibrio reitneri]